MACLSPGHLHLIKPKVPSAAPSSQGPTACPQIPTYESILKIHPPVVHEFHSSNSQDKNLGANDSVEVLGGSLCVAL